MGKESLGCGERQEDFSKARVSAASLANRTAGGGGVPLRAVPFSIWRMAVSAKPGSRSPRMLHWVSRDVESEKSLKAALVG